MSTTIRDINGNKVKKTLRHFSHHLGNAGNYHTDSTGLFCCDYCDEDFNGFQAFIRPETSSERNAVKAAKSIGEPRD